MAISELQIALVGAGVAAVGAVWAYNAWQDRRHRATAAKIFKEAQGDALLGAGGDGHSPAEPAAAPAPEAEQRREPHLGVASPDAAPGASAEAVAEASPTPAAGTEAAPPPAAPAVTATGPQAVDGIAGTDRVADCVLRLRAAEPVPAPAVWAMQNAWAGDLTKPLHWFARADAEGAWRPLATGDTGRYRDWAAALQLVDRRGPVADSELARFFEGVQGVARQAGAELELPARGETALRAARLDEFCAGVDLQFVLQVVEATGGVFAGTKLRGVAEAAGLVLEADGVFRARDADGGELFAVANLGTERLAADTIKSLATNGLTLSLDVPRVADGVQAFDRMLAVARQFATALGGVLVDAQRTPLSDAMIAAIRAKTAELQQRMREAGIDPGSPLALRLFS